MCDNIFFFSFSANFWFGPKSDWAHNAICSQVEVANSLVLVVLSAAPSFCFIREHFSNKSLFYNTD